MPKKTTGKEQELDFYSIKAAMAEEKKLEEKILTLQQEQAASSGKRDSIVRRSSKSFNQMFFGSQGVTHLKELQSKLEKVRQYIIGERGKLVQESMKTIDDIKSINPDFPSLRKVIKARNFDSLEVQIVKAKDLIGFMHENEISEIPALPNGENLSLEVLEEKISKAENFMHEFNGHLKALQDPIVLFLREKMHIFDAKEKRGKSSSIFDTLRAHESKLAKVFFPLIVGENATKTELTVDALVKEYFNEHYTPDDMVPSGKKLQALQDQFRHEFIYGAKVSDADKKLVKLVPGLAKIHSNLERLLADYAKSLTLFNSDPARYTNESNKIANIKANILEQLGALQIRVGFMAFVEDKLKDNPSIDKGALPSSEFKRAHKVFRSELEMLITRERNLQSNQSKLRY